MKGTRIGLSPEQIAAVRGLADCSMNVSKAARELFVHRNTLVYRLRHVKMLTGLDPMNFRDLCALVQMIEQR